jgi:hypothetical protein
MDKQMDGTIALSRCGLRARLGARVKAIWIRCFEIGWRSSA